MSPRVVALALRFGVALGSAGCGYQLVHTTAGGAGPFAVKGAPLQTPDAALAAATEDGARAELSRAGDLGGREARRVVEIELVRVDEASEAIAVASGTPRASAVRVTAIGRARVRRADDAVIERETGDVRVSEVAEAATDVPSGAVVRDSAGRAAARRLGEALVRRLLGRPEPGEP
jgi:hypothetical protein